MLCLAEILANYNVTYFKFICPETCGGRFQWWRYLRLPSEATRLLGLQVRIPRGARMSVSCGCRVLSGRGLGAGLITCPEESYSVLCV